MPTIQSNLVVVGTSLARLFGLAGGLVELRFGLVQLGDPRVVDVLGDATA